MRSGGSRRQRNLQETPAKNGQQALPQVEDLSLRVERANSPPPPGLPSSSKEASIVGAGRFKTAHPDRDRGQPTSPRLRLGRLLSSWPLCCLSLRASSRLRSPCSPNYPRPFVVGTAPTCFSSLFSHLFGSFFRYPVCIR